MRYLLLLSIVIASCYKPRPVELPFVQQQSDWISPIEYIGLIDNLKTSISLLNTQNYIRCMHTQTYRYLPAASLVSGNQLVWDNWSVNDEREYLENVSRDREIGTPLVVAFSNDAVQFLTADSLRFTSFYQLTLSLKDSVLPDMFKGQLEFIMRRNAAREWEITQWTDFETAKDSSWSRLKLQMAL
jgi:hypothetical protein